MRFYLLYIPCILMAALSVNFAVKDAVTAKKADFADETVVLDKVIAKAVESVKTADSTLKTEVKFLPPFYCYKQRDYLDEAFQTALWDEWNSVGLPREWYPYMIGLIYQECGFNRLSVNRNADGSEDIGYFQYNTRWYYSSAAKYGKDDAHINSPDDQLWLFCKQMKDRYDRGLSMEQAISCHRRGNNGPYDAEYVELVKMRTASLHRYQ